MPILPPPPKHPLLETVNDPGLEYLESQKCWRKNFATARLRAERFLNDHRNHPERYPRCKRYLLADEVPLKPEFQKLHVSFIDVLARRRTRRENARGPLALADVSTLLMSTYGLQKFLPGADPDRSWQRTVPSPGGLYPSEIYFWSLRTVGLPNGIYHFHPERATLERLPFDCDWLRAEELTPGLPPDSGPRVAGVVLVSSVFERLRKKYGNRYMRFCFMEAGAICHNFDLVGEALELVVWHQGIVEEESACRLLHIDGQSEAVVHAMAILDGPAAF